MIELNKHSISELSVREYLTLTDDQKNYALTLMSDVQRSLFRIRLSQRNSIGKMCNKDAYRGTQRTLRMVNFDVNYILLGDTPGEIARRLREYGCRKISDVASISSVDQKLKAVEIVASLDRSATLISNMATLDEAKEYLESIL